MDLIKILIIIITMMTVNIDLLRPKIIPIIYQLMQKPKNVKNK